MQIKFLHYRATSEDSVTTNNPNGVESRRGATVGYIQEEDKPIRFATAYCHHRDNYSKKSGRLKVTAHLEHNSQRCEDTDLTDRTEFIQAMDAEMFGQYGYTRV